jgi:hypothetical protein
MAKTNAYEAALLDLIFINTNIANLGDATGIRGSVTAGQLFVSLHTADPGEAGTQTTSEVVYTGYARVGVNRSGSDFTRINNSISPAANIDFPACTGGTATATHFGIGVASTGGSTLLYRGAISPTISIASGVTPRLTTASAVTEE